MPGHSSDLGIECRDVTCLRDVRQEDGRAGAGGIPLALSTLVPRHIRGRK